MSVSGTKSATPRTLCGGLTQNDTSPHLHAHGIQCTVTSVCVDPQLSTTTTVNPIKDFMDDIPKYWDVTSDAISTKYVSTNSNMFREIAYI